ncbi:MAG TPA: ribosome biogenesis GTPase Der [Actinomycetota bacterium]|nr:ribosome biogenesis GTPase Der [Actinomycetota bacterium]
MSAPAVAVVGRQNVGKSTLVNRLFGGREAIAHEMPGVTRDRVELEASWRGRAFRLVDTGGFAQGARGIEALVSDQAERAARAADVVLLVVDAQTGPVEEDSTLARRLRRAEVPVLVVVNKVDSERDEADVPAFHRLGLGDPVPVSALHGRGSGDLLDRLVAILPEDEAEHDQDLEEPRFAIVGRPNVGKSSLFNRLVGEERSVVFEESGTTRDAVDALVEWDGAPVRFVDTAGFRRPARAQGVEYYSFLRAERAIERAHVILLVLDASEGFAGEDKRIAARVMEFGRGLVVVANKWDLVEERDRTFKELTELLSPYARAPLLRTSAVTGTGVLRLPPVLSAVRERWRRRAPTARVNEVIANAQAERQAPGGARYRYATQVTAAPPRFVLFGAEPADASYQRFLEGRLRRALDLDGVPVRLRFRKARRRGQGGGRHR